MRTAIVTNIWLDGARTRKAERILAWYSQPELFDIVKWDRYFFLDNGSKFTKNIPGAEVLNFQPHLEHGDHVAAHQYPHSWRAIYSLRSLIDQYDKIIWLDDDAFILSKRLAQYVADLKAGWTAFWCPKYGFPEGAFWVLCRNGGQETLERWCSEMSWNARNGRLWENEIPFTQVERGFNCDRYGEGDQPQQKEWDFSGQVQLDFPLIFDMEGG